jgi:hypothetical protein
MASTKYIFGKKGTQRVEEKKVGKRVEARAWLRRLPCVRGLCVDAVEANGGRVEADER